MPITYADETYSSRGSAKDDLETYLRGSRPQSLEIIQELRKLDKLPENLKPISDHIDHIIQQAIGAVFDQCRQAQQMHIRTPAARYYLHINQTVTDDPNIDNRWNGSSTKAPRYEKPTTVTISNEGIAAIIQEAERLYQASQQVPSITTPGQSHAPGAGAAAPQQPTKPQPPLKNQLLDAMNTTIKVTANEALLSYRTEHANLECLKGEKQTLEGEKQTLLERCNTQLSAMNTGVAADTVDSVDSVADLNQYFQDNHEKLCKLYTNESDIAAQQNKLQREINDFMDVASSTPPPSEVNTESATQTAHPKRRGLTIRGSKRNLGDHSGDEPTAQTVTNAALAQNNQALLQVVQAQLKEKIAEKGALALILLSQKLEEKETAIAEQKTTLMDAETALKDDLSSAARDAVEAQARTSLSKLAVLANRAEAKDLLKPTGEQTYITDIVNKNVHRLLNKETNSLTLQLGVTNAESMLLDNIGDILTKNYVQAAADSTDPYDWSAVASDLTSQKNQQTCFQHIADNKPLVSLLGSYIEQKKTTNSSTSITVQHSNLKDFCAKHEALNAQNGQWNTRQKNKNEDSTLTDYNRAYKDSALLYDFYQHATKNNNEQQLAALNAVLKDTSETQKLKLALTSAYAQANLTETDGKALPVSIKPRRTHKTAHSDTSFRYSLTPQLANIPAEENHKDYMLAHQIRIMESIASDLSEKISELSNTNLPTTEKKNALEREILTLQQAVNLKRKTLEQAMKALQQPHATSESYLDQVKALFTGEPDSGSDLDTDAMQVQYNTLIQCIDDHKKKRSDYNAAVLDLESARAEQTKNQEAEKALQPVIKQLSNECITWMIEYNNLTLMAKQALGAKHKEIKTILNSEKIKESHAVNTEAYEKYAKQELFDTYQQQASEAMNKFINTVLKMKSTAREGINLSNLLELSDPENLESFVQFHIEFNSGQSILEAVWAECNKRTELSLEAPHTRDNHSAPESQREKSLLTESSIMTNKLKVPCKQTGAVGAGASRSTPQR